jgi:hypothetical protein
MKKTERELMIENIKRMRTILNEAQVDMFDSITIDKKMSPKDAYFEFLKNFAISAGEKHPEKLSPNDLDKKYTRTIRKKYDMEYVPHNFPAMGVELINKGLIKRK